MAPATQLYSPPHALRCHHAIGLMQTREGLTLPWHSRVPTPFALDPHVYTRVHKTHTQTRVHTHSQVTCKQPSVASATYISCPSQNWPEQLAICSSVCPSVHWRRQNYLGALCGRVPATLWNPQKLIFVPFSPCGTVALAPRVTPCQVLAGHRHVFDGSPTEARGKVSWGC